MTMNLIATNRNAPNTARDNWAALVAISAADAASPYPTEGYVFVSPDAIVRLAAVLDDTALTNGEFVTSYNFSDEEDGHIEAHVNAFGPSLLPQEQMAKVREILAPFPQALAMIDEVVARRLQVSFSTDVGGSSKPHLKAVNWNADEVEINRCEGNMIAMLRDLGLSIAKTGAGETDFDTFAAAVNDNAALTDYPASRLRDFVACGRRQGATHVYWA